MRKELWFGFSIMGLVLLSILLIAKYAKGFIANISVLLGIVIGGVAGSYYGAYPEVRLLKNGGSGTFTLDAAETICGADLDLPQLLDQLAHAGGEGRGAPHDGLGEGGQRAGDLRLEREEVLVRSGYTRDGKRAARREEERRVPAGRVGADEERVDVLAIRSAGTRRLGRVNGRRSSV